jgi:hypothetical protein
MLCLGLHCGIDNPARKSLSELQKEMPLSLYRLPFHDLLQDPWKVLIPELSEATIPRLLPLCHPLELLQDKFYTTVIDNLVKKLV